MVDRMPNRIIKNHSKEKTQMITRTKIV